MHLYEYDAFALHIPVPGLGTKTSFYGVWVCYGSAQLPLPLICNAKMPNPVRAFWLCLHDKFWKPKLHYAPCVDL